MEISKEQIEQAINQLAKSDRGRDTMDDLIKFLETSAWGLDGKNQTAVITLLIAAWDSWYGTVLQSLRKGQFTDFRLAK